MSKRKSSSMIFLGAISGAVLTFLATESDFLFAQANPSATTETATYQALALFGDVFEEVSKNFVEQPDPAKLVKFALSGMLSGLDPHSGYMDPKGFSELQVETRGQFGGVGIEVIS